MKLKEFILSESVTIKSKESRLGPGMYNLKLYSGKNEIGMASVYKDRYGSDNAMNLSVFIIYQKYRGTGFGYPALAAVKQFMLKIDPSSKFVMAEPMSQKILHLNERVFGKPIYISDDIRKYSLEDAYKLLPPETSDDLSGRKIYTVYRLKK